MNIKTAKKLLREKRWTRLDRNGAASFPLSWRGVFQTSLILKRLQKKLAAERVEKAKVVFANPDYAQKKEKAALFLYRKHMKSGI